MRITLVGVRLSTGKDSGLRVFVNVIVVTENGSPAKYDHWEGVTTTRIVAYKSLDITKWLLAT
jgi:hypothetical protein